jgi:uncharacterized delta-60 repeat protein
MMKKKHSIRPVILFLFLLLISNSALPGALDPTFGNGGKATFSFPESTTNYRSFGFKIFVQPSNRIVGGGVFTKQGPDGQEPGVVLIGLNPNGTSDTTFGTSSGMIQDYTAAASTSFSDAIMQPDGKVIRLSQFFPLFAFPSGNVIRTTVDGLNDSGFSANVNVGSSNTIPLNVGLLPSGKIMVVVFAQTNPESFTLYRLNPDGSRDTNFGTNGAKQLTWLGRLPSPRVTSMEVLPNGKVVLTGNLGPGSIYNEFFIARLNPDGNFDGMFGRQGMVRYRFGTGVTGYITDLVVRADGTYIVSGAVNNPDSDSFMVGFTRRGKTDGTFGVKGVVISDISPGGTDAIYSLVENAGKLIAAGEAPTSPGSRPNFLLARFSASGLLEAHTKTEFTAGQFARAEDVMVQPDGKILVIGSTYNPATLFASSSMWAIARYTDITNDPPRPDPSNK